MTPADWRKVAKHVDYLNKEYERSGSTIRARKTNDPTEPIEFVQLTDLSQSSFPDREKIMQELNLYKLTKPI